MKKLLLLLPVALLSAQAFAQDGGILPRDPALSPDGSMVSFSFQGDIWVSPLNGGQARRLTIHEGYESTPKWSPNGSRIAFTGNRYGNNDIFVIDADGGASTRITYRSSNDLVTDWGPKDQLYVETARAFRQVERDAEVHKVSANGGTPIRFLNSFGNMANVSPNGRFIAHTRGNCRISREDYDGPADKDIWIYDTQNDSYIELTDNSINDYLPVWGNDNTLYFISARSGRYNIYKQSIDGNGNASGEPEQLTNYRDNGVRYFDVSANNEVIVFERDTNLYRLGTSGGRAQTVNLDVKADYRFDPVETITFTNGVGGFSVSPNGKLVAMGIRGEIFVKENNREKNRTVNITNHGYRDRDMAWLNDSTVVYASDRNGNQYDLFVAKSSDPNKSDIFKSIRHESTGITRTREDEREPIISPDGKKIAYRLGRGGLITADIDENGRLSNKKTLLDGWDTPRGISWSPDSKWLAYSLNDLNFDSEIYIHAADDSQEPVNVSMHPKGDFAPVWSPDGSKLGFISERNNDNYGIWYAWLNKEDWEKTRLDREEGYYFDDEEDKPAKKGKGDKSVEPINIDFENIHDRLFQVTFLPGNEGSLVISADGETFYFSSSDPASFGSDIYSVKFDRSELKAVTKGGQNVFGLRLSHDKKSLVGVSRGRLVSVNPGSGRVTPQSFRATANIDHSVEREQVFEEAWRELNHGFYDPDFHGYDWDALKRTYKPWAMKASTRQDFQYIANWMLGQLNSSHMGVRGGANPEDTQRDRTGLLGIEPGADRNGVRVNRIVPGSPADQAKSKLNVGDVITSIDGNEVGASTNLYSLLKGTINQQVLLGVRAENGDEREVVIQPIASLNTLLYEEYIASRKKLTDEYSNGRLGYIHIRSMNVPSFERFERELKASGYGKDGIVIDVRWNGGGSTTDLLMAVLTVTQHAYTVPRGAAKDISEHTKFTDYYPLSRLPGTGWLRPSIALANQTSYSNAEIFSHAYKNVGVGKLVGMPTFGAVISTGASGLMDGSSVRMPFRGWFVKQTLENMEHGPAVPDIIIENSPNAKANGVDEQLKRAVEELLKDVR